MEITTLASSSGGNSALITEGGEAILIDSGISLRRTERIINALGIRLSDIKAVLITHSHSDHVGHLMRISQKGRMPVISSPEAKDDVMKYAPEGSVHIPSERNTELKVGPFLIKSFKTPHDSRGSVGYRVSAGGRSLALITDLGTVTGEVREGALGADLAVLESNHDIAMLKGGSYPGYLKRRILSDTGHLSNIMAAEFAYELASSGTRRIILAHISVENNTPELALETCVRRLRSGGVNVSESGDCRVTYAPQLDVGKTFII